MRTSTACNHVSRVILSGTKQCWTLDAGTAYVSSACALDTVFRVVSPPRVDNSIGLCHIQTRTITFAHYLRSLGGRSVLRA